MVSHLGGFNLDMKNKHVMECGRSDIGRVDEEDLGYNYQTH